MLIQTVHPRCRWHLAVQGRKETRNYVLNGAALCISFFLIRILAYGAGLGHLWTLRRYWMGPGVPYLRRRVPVLRRKC